MTVPTTGAPAAQQGAPGQLQNEQGMIAPKREIKWLDIILRIIPILISISAFGFSIVAYIRAEQARQPHVTTGIRDSFYQALDSTESPCRTTLFGYPAVYWATTLSIVVDIENSGGASIWLRHVRDLDNQNPTPVMLNDGTMLLVIPHFWEPQAYELWIGSVQWRQRESARNSRQYLGNIVPLEIKGREIKPIVLRVDLMAVIPLDSVPPEVQWSSDLIFEFGAGDGEIVDIKSIPLQRPKLVPPEPQGTEWPSCSV